MAVYRLALANCKQMLTKVHVWYLAVYLASLNGVQKYRDDPVALDAQNFQATKAVQIL